LPRLALIRFEYSARRWEVARVLPALPQEFLKQGVDGSHARSCRRIDPSDERIESPLEIFELLDADRRKIGIGGIKQVGIDLVASDPQPEALKVGCSRKVLAILENYIKIASEKFGDVMHVGFQLPVKLDECQQERAQDRLRPLSALVVIDRLRYAKEVCLGASAFLILGAMGVLIVGVVAVGIVGQLGGVIAAAFAPDIVGVFGLRIVVGVMIRIILHSAP
jgi:hypothetical protein